MEVISFISFFLGATWDFFTEINVPGFNFSFAALFVGLFIATLGLRFLFLMLGTTGTMDDIRFMSTFRRSNETHLAVRDRDR